jgi:hypothetical protein
MIPAKIEKKTPGYEAYVADVTIGTPPKTYRLKISFSFDDLILYKNLEFESTSYCEVSGGNDLLHIGSEIYRIPIISDPRRTLITDESYCEDCVGILGLGYGSVFWKMWPEMSFSRNNIYLNTINPEFIYNRKGEIHVLNCEYPQIDGSLCKFTGDITFGKKVYSNMKIEFALMDENILLPEAIYDEYMKNKNIYKGDPSKWGKIHLNSTINPFNLFEVNIEKFDKFKSFKNTIKFDIKPENYIRYITNGGKKFGIKPSTTNSLRIGVEGFRNFIFHRSIINSQLILKESTTNDFLSLENIILIGIALWLLMKWIITDINNIEEIGIPYRNRFWSIVFELIGIGITIASYVLPSTLSILSGYLIIYILTGVVLGVTLVFKIASIGISLIKFRKARPVYQSQNSEVFEVNIVRSLTQEVLLLLALWILLIERRLELASTALVLLVNVYIVYRLTFYLVIMTLYSLYKKGREKTPFFMTFLIFVIILYLYQVLATINFFIRPLFVRDFQIYEKVIVPFLIILYFFLVCAAIYMSRIYFRKATTKYLVFFNSKKNNRKDMIEIPEY